MYARYALFVKISNEWRFEGFEETEKAVEHFKRVVQADIDQSAKWARKTQAYKVVALELT